MKRWLVGALSLVISLFGLVGHLTVQAQVNANQTSEEFAGADEKEESALRSSNSKRSRAAAPKCDISFGTNSTLPRYRSTIVKSP